MGQTQVTVRTQKLMLWSFNFSTVPCLKYHGIRRSFLLHFFCQGNIYPNTNNPSCCMCLLYSFWWVGDSWSLHFNRHNEVQALPGCPCLRLVHSGGYLAIDRSILTVLEYTSFEYVSCWLKSLCEEFIRTGNLQRCRHSRTGPLGIADQVFSGDTYMCPVRDGYLISRGPERWGHNCVIMLE